MESNVACVIERRDLDELLLAAVPSIARRLEPVQVEVGNDGERLDYVRAGAVARHIVALYKAGRVEEVRQAFDMIERLHLEGEPYVRELATIGYLEDLQNLIDADDEVDREQIEALLGAESRRWWRGLDTFWSRGEGPVQPVDGSE